MTDSKYFFTLKQIKRINSNDKELDSLIQASEPIVITNSGLVQTAIDKWNLDYLKNHLTKSTYSVFRSKTSRFLYWDDKKCSNLNRFAKPTELLQMNFKEFCEVIELWSDNDEYKYYLQQPLNNSVDQEIVFDFLKFNWSWINDRKQKALWGDLTSNLLLISQAYNLTPCHYDEQENFLAQINGDKHCVLFSPDMFKYLYTYPVYHPCDRQSMANLSNPNFDLHPELKNLQGYEAIISPGDVLYIPSYWFHQIESLPTTNTIMSINFWFKAPITDPSELRYPLKGAQKIAIMRNIEKMVTQVLKNTDEVPDFLRQMIVGRYTK